MADYPKEHCGSPLITNAHINRMIAVRCFEAGMAPADIAKEWPEVFRVTVEDGTPKLGIKYDYEIADGSGRLETKRTILKESADKAIRAFKSARRRAAKAGA